MAFAGCTGLHFQSPAWMPQQAETGTEHNPRRCPHSISGQILPLSHIAPLCDRLTAHRRRAAVILPRSSHPHHHGAPQHQGKEGWGGAAPSPKGQHRVGDCMAYFFHSIHQEPCMEGLLLAELGVPGQRTKGGTRTPIPLSERRGVSPAGKACSHPTADRYGWGKGCSPLQQEGTEPKDVAEYT